MSKNFSLKATFVATATFFFNVAIETKSKYLVAIATLGKLAPPDLKHHRWSLYQLFLLFLLQLQQLKRKKVHKKIWSGFEPGTLERKPTTLPVS